MVDRRTFVLGTAAALALPGCGSRGRGGGPRSERALTPTDVEADVELLNGLLEVEASAVAFYAGAGRGGRVLEHERAHADRLRHAVGRLGGIAATGDAGLRPATADDLEQTMVAAYLDTLPKLVSADLRELVASIAAVEAEHLAALALASHRPASTAFVTGERRA